MPDSSPRDFPDHIPAPDDIETIHIVGICGTAMGSLAAMLQQKGYSVRGSDAMAYPPMSTWLAERNIDIIKGYDESNLDWDPDLVIIGNVCREEYGDAVATRNRGFPYLSFPEALRYFFFDRQHPLVVTGTHGKTTTTAMLAWLLYQAGHDPSMFVGGVTGNFQSNYRLGEGDAFVIEGDEYDTAYFDKVPKFWHYKPFRATINNVEYDHADIYEDIETIERMFETFVDLIPAEGSLWVNGDDDRAMAVSEHAADRRRTFGLGEQNDLRAADIDYSTDGSHSTDARIELEGQSLGTFTLPVIGEFNVRNFLGATGIALDEGLSPDEIRDAIPEFNPVRKRQEVIGTANGITVIDDFAHHPTAVRATLEAVRASYPDRRIWAIFEAKSNTSRRKVFQHDYPPAFSPADRVVISSPFEKKDSLSEDEQIDIDRMVDDIRELGPSASALDSADQIVEKITPQLHEGDVVVGLSGSNFDDLHHKLLSAIRD